MDLNAATLTREIITKIDDLNRQAWEVHISQPKLGLELSTKAKGLSEEISYQKGIAYALRNMGVSYRYLSEPEKALSLSFEALELFISTGEKSGEAQSYVSIGALYYYMGDFDRGLDFFLKGLHLSEECGNKEAQAYAYNGAGYIYGVTLGDHKKGLEFLGKALTISKEIDMLADLQPRILDGMAEIYLNDGQMEKAYKSALECLDLCEKYSQKVLKVDSLYTMGNILSKQNKLDESQKYFSQSAANARDIGYKVGEAYCLLELGKIASLQTDTAKAKNYFVDTLTLAESIKAKGVIYKAHEGLADVYEKEGDLSSFVTHFKLFHKYKSEVFKDEQENKLRYLNVQHDIEQLKKEAEISRLTNVVMKEKNEELEKKTQELEQSYNSVSVLSKIGQDITSTLDLDVILNTVYENVNQLMDATVFGVGIYREEENVIEYRLAIEEGKRFKPYRREMSDKSQLAVWCIENNSEIFINDINNEYSKYLQDIEHAVPGSVVLEDGSMPKNPNSLIYLPLQVKDKMIGLISVQSYEKNAYSPNHLNILKTLASYTSAALYNADSFQSLQTALNKLKLTQEQLIQSEKMASLGELTAGIAHEIQNPLNFVNNFSEVNKELLEEILVEVAMGKTGEVKNLVKDVIENETKILHHGKRADAIVKGMLQHSRISSGKKEPADLNALCDEYIRLSYHGLRAKDKSFNADIKTEFDPTIGKINMVSQDIGRVVLNLLNNAFYTVNEKRKLTPDHYEPMVSIITRKINDGVEIRIMDNGSGMSQKIIDKIFQPFFTTKPTGQGTGLGLSLSYDIITKAHNGELKVETEPGKGSTFIVSIPFE